MMSKAIIGLVVCIASAALVNAGHVPESLGYDLNKDFGRLNDWLAKSLADEQADIEKSLAHVKSNMDELRGVGLGPVANLFLILMDGQQCNEKVLTAFNQLLAAGLQLDTNELHLKRVMRPKLDSLISSCGAYIDEKVSELRRDSLEAGIGRFLERLLSDYKPVAETIKSNPQPETGDRYKSYIADHPKGGKRWAQRLEELAKNDPKKLTQVKSIANVGGLGRIERERKFPYIYKKYLVQPCRLLTKTLWDTFMGLNGLLQQRAEFVSERSLEVKQLLYGFNECQNVLLKGSRYVSRYFY